MCMRQVYDESILTQIYFIVICFVYFSERSTLFENVVCMPQRYTARDLKVLDLPSYSWQRLIDRVREMRMRFVEQCGRLIAERLDELNMQLGVITANATVTASLALWAGRARFAAMDFEACDEDSADHLIMLSICELAEIQELWKFEVAVDNFREMASRHEV